MNHKIKFGWRVPDFPMDGSSSADFRNQMVGYLDTLQEDFASFWVADHFVPWYDQMDPMIATYEAWTTLTYLAGHFTKMMAGNIVLCQSYRPPALVAKMAATLQALTQGRFILGIGAGWKRDEYLAYGYEYPPAAAIRIHQLDEAVQIIRRMWTKPKTTFHGRYYFVDDAICEPKPDPLPPLMIGGGGEQITLRIVAEQADWWNVPNYNPKNYQLKLDVLRQHCQSVGRDYDSIVKTVGLECVAVAATSAQAEQIAKASLFSHMEGSLIGTPDQIAKTLKLYTDMGVQHFMLRFADFPRTDGAELFFREVAPRFA
jgi:alkanesulfonate monooxygenase SsuD/methylene tetrahydromethanopterin reductase-like flavin-dependent oxidoreductase (luciferase family)